MSRRIVSVLMSCLLCAVAVPAQTTPAGVIQQSAGAHLNTTEAPVGTTVYDGDRLETQDKGALSLRSGQIQLSMLENSQLWMNHENSILTPTLQRGTVIFRAETGQGVEIRADDVRVRPHNAVLTIGQVTIEKCDVLVTAQTQQLEVTAGRETKILDEGKTYRVTRANACGAAEFHAPIAAGASRFLLVAAAVVGVLTIPPIVKSLESPDRP
ncbi:MAG: hypothetical protein WBG02_04665 [Candidatus Acidiferrum sp.]